MSKSILIASLVGIVVVVVAVAMIFYGQRGSHIDLTGKILKVRTAPIDENSSLAVVDFRVTDPADYPFMAKGTKLVLVDASGKEIEGSTISEPDAKRLFEAIPLLGTKYNPSLSINEKVSAHQTLDRMTSARFEVPDSALEKRKNLILRIEEVDQRATAEIMEK
jgi:hypothetical protein